jgi:hypothetical protein
VGALGAATLDVPMPLELRERRGGEGSSRGRSAFDHSTRPQEHGEAVHRCLALAGRHRNHTFGGAP